MRARFTRHFPACSGRAAIALPGRGDLGRGRSGERRLTIFYTAEVHGTLEPCGCTSDPLGDVARYAALVARRDARRRRAAGRRRRALVPRDQHRQGAASDRPRARAFLGDALAKLGAVRGGAGRDGHPRAGGRGRARADGGQPAAARRRLAPSLARDRRRDPRRRVRESPIPALAAALGGGKGEDPVAAAQARGRRGCARSRRRARHRAGARRQAARAPARRATRGSTSSCSGGRSARGWHAPSRWATRYLVAAADELQRVGRIDIVWRGAGPLVDAGGPEAAALRRVEIDQGVARASTMSSKAWTAPRAAAIRRSSPPSDAERDGADRRAQPRWTSPWKPPRAGRYFTNRLIPLRRSLPRDPKVAADMRRLDAKIAAVNLKSAEPPPPPEPGRPYYVGDDQVRELPQDGDWRSGRRPCTRRPGRRWSRAASRTTTSASAATSPATARSAAPASATPRSCATCSARSATARARPTSPPRGSEEPPSVHRGDARQHLHGLPHRAALRHVPVRGLPARHPRRRSRRRARARSSATARRGTSCGPPRSRAPRSRARRRRPTRRGRPRWSSNAEGADGGRRSAAGRAGRARCCRR